MLSYDTAKEIVDRYALARRGIVTPFDLDGVPQVFYTLDFCEEMGGWAYWMLADMYDRQHGSFEPYFVSYVEDYIRAKVPWLDAAMLCLACLADEKGRILESWSVTEDAWQAGLAEMLDSYLSGVPLEHILA